MALTTRTLNNTGAPLCMPDGSLVPNGTQITFTLVRPPGLKTIGDAIDATTSHVVGSKVTTTTTAGVFSCELWPNDRGNVVTQYLCKINANGFVDCLGSMPSGVGAYSFANFKLSGAPLTPTELSLLTEHINDQAVHLTAAQNTFLDALNLPTLTATEVNFLDGATSNVQTQIDGKQPLDAQLTAIAALVPSADKLQYWTALTTAALCDFTSFGRSLVAAADAAAGATLIGAVPTTRTISTTAPLAGGGDLSANRTITTSVTASKVMGRGSAGGTGVMQELVPQSPLAISGTDLTTVIDNPSLLGRGDAGPGAAREMTVQAPLALGSTTVTTSMATGRLIGRSTAGTGVMEELEIGDGLELSSGILTATVGAEKLTQADIFTDFIVSGLDVDTAQEPDIFLNAGVAYADGKRVAWAGGQIGVAGDFDYYIDISYAGGVAVDGVAHGDPPPALASGYFRIGKLVSNGVTISSAERYAYGNLAAGNGALGNVTTGTNNVAFGTSAGLALVDGNGNTLFGDAAGAQIESGSNNTIVGAGSGGGLESGSGNTILGAGLDGFAAGMNDTLVLGAGGAQHIVSDVDYSRFLRVPVVPEYTLATLPVAVRGALIYVNDSTTSLNGSLCFGNNDSDWIDASTGLVVT